MKPKPLDKLVYFLLVLFVALNVADLALTVAGINFAGEKERNPLLGHYNLGGVTLLDAALKMLIASLMSYALYRLYKYSLRDDSPIAEILILVTLVVSNIYYGYVVAGNVSVLITVG